MTLLELRRRYQLHYSSLGQRETRDHAAELAVGGDFEAVGALEYYALKAHGLAINHRVVDVGCGTGRLSVQLARRGHEHYAGFDLMPEAVDHARAICRRPDWTFAVTDGLQIATSDGAADFVCFFSVFTHVAHEHTYLYLQESKRVLQAGGLVVFTFLEFKIPSHWVQFEAAILGFGREVEPIVFLDRAAIRSFAARLDLEVLALVDGDVPTFPIEEPITWEDGRVMHGRGYLGQSLAVLRKR